MTLVHRANTTAANVIQNISALRWDNLTAQWGGFSNTTTGAPNWGTVIWQVVSVYPDYVGPIAFLLLFGLPFIMMWIAHADMVPAAIVGFFFALYIFAYIGNQYAFAAIGCMMIAATSIIWSIWQKRG